jgi:hypothetical protein
MVNSKGGFLVEDDYGANDDLKTKERVRERERAMQSLEPRTCCTSFTLFYFTSTCVAGGPDASRYDQLSTLMRVATPNVMTVARWISTRCIEKYSDVSYATSAGTIRLRNTVF